MNGPTDDLASDATLLGRWRAGDERAATGIVERHAGALARFAASLGVREDIEELVQDTFVRAFGSIDGFRGEGSSPSSAGWCSIGGERARGARSRSRWRRGMR